MTNTLLLVVDFINDIVHQDGKISAGAQAVKDSSTMERANDAIAWARNSKHHLVFVKVGFSPDYIECPNHSPMFGQAEKFGALKLGEWGTEFHEDLDFQDGDKVITKHRVSAFYNTDLEAILRANQIETLILAGVSTNMAIFSTAREAHDRDYNVVVLSDACSTPDSAQQEMTLQMLERTGKVIKVSEL